MKLTFVVCCLALCCPALAFADATDDTALPKDYSWFSAGAGVGFGGYEGGETFGLTMYGLGAPLLVPGTTPFGTALVEAAFSERLRVGASLTGSYRKYDHRDESSQPDIVVPKEQSFLSASLSGRWVMNPGAVVEVSPMLSAGVNRGTVTGAQGDYVPSTTSGEPGTYLTADGTGYGFDARLGLVLEYRLLAQLYLRLESHFARAGWSHSELRTDTGKKLERERLNTTHLSFGWLPMLQLRLSF